MAILQNKIDFAAIVSVTRANINGDPLNGNRPARIMTAMAFSPTLQSNGKYATDFKIWVNTSLFKQTDARMILCLTPRSKRTIIICGIV